jgi:hypothetical protein
VKAVPVRVPGSCVAILLLFAAGVLVNLWTLSIHSARHEQSEHVKNILRTPTADPEAADWRLVEVEVRLNAVHLLLEKGGMRYPVYLVQPRFRLLQVHRRTTTYTVHVPAFPPGERASFGRAVDALTERLATKESEFPWRFQAIPVPLPPGLLRVAFLAILVLLVWLARDLWRSGGKTCLVFQVANNRLVQSRSTGELSQRYRLVADHREACTRSEEMRRAALAVLSTGGLAGALRFGLAEWTPLHNGCHGWQAVDYLTVPLEYAHGPFETRHYGLVQEALCDLFFLVLPRQEAWFFGLQAALGVALCWAGAWAAWAIFRSRGAAFATAVFLALSPHAVRVAASESVFLWGGLFLFLGLAGLTIYWREGRVVGLWLGCLALFLGAQAHVALLGLAGVPLLIPLLPGTKEYRRGLAGLGLGVLILGLWLLPYAREAFSRDIKTNLSVLGDLWRLAVEANMVVSFRTAPAVQIFFLVAGAVVLLGRHPRIFLFFAGLGVLLLPAYLVGANYSDVVRYQHQMMLAATLVAGYGVSRLVRLVPREGRWWAAAGCLVLYGATLWGPLENVATPDTEGLEYAALRRTLGELPAESWIVHVGQEEMPFPVVSALPQVFGRTSRNRLRVLTRDEFRQRIAGGWPDRSVYWYEGLALHSLAVLAGSPDLERAEAATSTLSDLAAFRRRYSAEARLRYDLHRLGSPFPYLRYDYIPLPPVEENLTLTLYRLHAPAEKP